MSKLKNPISYFNPGDDCDTDKMCVFGERCIEKKCRPRGDFLNCKCGEENNNVRNFNRIIKGSKVSQV